MSKVAKILLREEISRYENRIEKLSELEVGYLQGIRNALITIEISDRFLFEKVSPAVAELEGQLRFHDSRPSPTNKFERGRINGIRTSLQHIKIAEAVHGIDA